MKKKLFVLIGVLLTIISAGCSKDGDSEINDSEVKTIYHVLDKNGQESSVFNYGEEILFELIITNSTSHTLHYDDLNFINGAFIIYNSEGQIFNPIVSQAFIYRDFPITIASGEQFSSRLIWPWILVPLPAGRYYSTCTFNIDELSNKMYTINFEIK